MDVLDDVGAREVQEIGVTRNVARMVTEAFAAVVAVGEGPGLDRRPIGAVEHEDPFGQQRLESFSHGSTLASVLRRDQQARSSFRRGRHVGYAAGSGFVEAVEEAGWARTRSDR